jgi:hypothetical protein
MTLIAIFISPGGALDAQEQVQELGCCLQALGSRPNNQAYLMVKNDEAH